MPDGSRLSPQKGAFAERAIHTARGRRHRAVQKFLHAPERRLAGLKRVMAATAGAAPRVVRILITNVYDGSDYSAQLQIGSGNAVANVILDTGSSTLAVDPTVYNGAGDTDLQVTSYAQLVTYGTGGWAGPVVTTNVSFGTGANEVTLTGSFLAITQVQEPGNFQGVSGIAGLAYNGLNTAFDLQTYLAAKGKHATYPWLFPKKSWAAFEKYFSALTELNHVQQTTLTPYFDQVEDNGILANKFAFYTLRSWVSFRAGADQAAVAKDPLNNGVFVLGGGEDQTDLYIGDPTSFVTVDVLHDLYYNTNLLSVRVGNLEAVPAAPLQAQYVQYAVSNSIVDSGTSDLSLAQDVYDTILAGLKQTDPAYYDTVQQALAAAQGQNPQGIAASSLNLAQWPTIYFTLADENGQGVELAVAPSTYWQVDFPAAGQAWFQISGPLTDGSGPAPNQSILGLPLLNNYYTVFDRSEDSQGVIKFAPIRPPQA